MTLPINIKIYNLNHFLFFKYNKSYFFLFNFFIYYKNIWKNSKFNQLTSIKTNNSFNLKLKKKISLKFKLVFLSNNKKLNLNFCKHYNNNNLLNKNFKFNLFALIKLICFFDSFFIFKFLNFNFFIKNFHKTLIKLIVKKHKIYLFTKNNNFTKINDLTAFNSNFI